MNRDEMINRNIYRGFDYALNPKTGIRAFGRVELPTYATPYSAGADFRCAEKVTIPSIWKNVVEWIKHPKTEKTPFKPTLVHTGVKAYMMPDEVLQIFNRSSGPKKGLILANSVGIIDSDYADNPDNDGEIMFAFYNVFPVDVTIEVGDKIGQGIFTKFLRPMDQSELIIEKERSGGFGSTDADNVTSLTRERINNIRRRTTELDFPNSHPENDPGFNGPSM
jgi:dUTP pyrophosphatase